MRRLEFLYLVLLFSLTAVLSWGFVLVRDGLEGIEVSGVGVRQGERFEISVPVVPFERAVLSYSRGARLSELYLQSETTTYEFFADQSDAVIVLEYDGFFKARRVVSLNFRDFVDENEDNFPDTLVLDPIDALNFRAWFVNIATYQAISLSNNWSVRERDCSGLIRFAAREALKVHDQSWYFESGLDPLAWLELTGIDLRSIKDVNEYNYPAIPILGAKLFLDNDGRFTHFADAYNLLRSNMVYIGKDLRLARPGDIVFFHHPSPSTFHSMILTGEGLIYHTGPLSERDSGALKVWSLEDYMRMMPYQWLPIESNEYFIGVYRFKFLPRI